MTEFIAENREDLEADVIVIADSGILSQAFQR